MQCFTSTIRNLEQIAQKGGKLTDFQSILCDAKEFPQQLRAMTEWQSTAPEEKFECMQTDVTLSHHFDLNTPILTDFTSPIKRYLDIVVHRFVTAMISRSHYPPHEKKDIENLCRSCMDFKSNERRFEEAFVQSKSSFSQPDEPVAIAGVVNEITDRNMSILWQNSDTTILCHNSDITTSSWHNSDTTISSVPNRCVIDYKYLNLSEKPTKRCLQWLIRIYNPHGAHKEQTRSNPVTNIPMDIWCEMLEDLKNNKIDNLRRTAGSLSRYCTTENDGESNEQEVPDDENDFISVDSGANSDEMFDILEESEDEANEELNFPNAVIHNNEHYKRVTLDIYPGKVLQFWINWPPYQEAQATILRVGSDIDICIEHNRFPIRCFSELSGTQASKETYSDVEFYKESWMPAIKMEASVSAVEDADRIILNEVKVIWNLDLPNMIGTFELSSNFCERFFVNFSQGDYICARIIINDKSQTNQKEKKCVESSKEEKKLVKKSNDYMWCGHFLVTEINREKRVVRVNIRFHQSCQKLPSDAEFKKAPVTLELLPQLISNRLGINVLVENIFLEK